jgi:broad specificity phosphatase PhoE
LQALELAAVRHGRTAWNLSGRFQGQTDISLDETGRAQARAVARRLAGERFDVAVCSDLVRASETAELLTAGHTVQLERDPRWREMRFGRWEGLTWDEIVARYPEQAAHSETVPKFYTPVGGETFDELCERIAAALGALRERDVASALVVTHAGPLHALLRVALGESEASALGVRFTQASVTRLRFGPAGAELVSLNESLAEEIA